MKSRIIALLSCVTLLLATATVFADTFKPKIYQVFVDDNGLMTILGTGFPEGGYVQTLKVGGIPATDIVYDGVADSVQAQVPAQLGPGDYRLLVNFKLNNNAKNVTWDLSIGPQGPQGEQGEQGKLGEAGDQGVQGKLGPPGGEGAQGAQGKLGTQGAQGKMGPPGLGGQGEQGKLGPQGEQGKIGPQGQDGTGCTLGECLDTGEATLSCGSTETVIPCVPPVACPCFDMSTFETMQTECAADAGDIFCGDTGGATNLTASCSTPPDFDTTWFVQARYDVPTCQVSDFSDGDPNIGNTTMTAEEQAACIDLLQQQHQVVGFCDTGP